MRLPAAQTSASAVRAGPPSRIPPTTESPLPLRPLSHRAGPLTNRETMPTAATKEVSTESTHTQTAAAPPGSSPGLGETPATQQCLQRERSSSSQISSETSPGASPLIGTCVGVTTSASATAGSVTETRFSLSVVLIRRDLPTITRSGAAPAVMLWPDADVAAVEDCAAGGLSWFGEPWFGESWFGEEREAVARAAG